MKFDISSMMQKAQAMQENLQKVQQELADVEVIGESGAGMVKVTINGKREVKRVEIDPEVFKEDHEMTEDLCAAATNDALTKIEKAIGDKMQDSMGGLGLPAGFKLPF